MDEAVEQQMARSTDEQGAQRAANLRRNQQGERTRLQREIETEQRKIQTLSEERAPIAAEVRKVEAEVGPIKYIAALIYGDNPDANLLEKAVRWVIIILVVVFDPLAIFMLLAATESYKWEKYGRQGDPEEHTESAPESPVLDRVNQWRDRWQQWRTKDAVDNVSPVITPSVDERPAGDPVDSEPVAEVVEQPQDAQPGPALDPEPADSKVEYRVLGDADDEDPLPDQPKERPFMAGRRGEEKFLAPAEKDFPDVSDKFTFGNDFPLHANRGDQFLRTDTLPTMLYKYNGEKWISIDKNNHDRYTYDEQYINFLITRISSGEYDPELLTDSERQQIEERLRKDQI